MTPDAAPPPPPGGRSTHFDFEHPVFRVPGARFILAGDHSPSMVMLLGDVEVLVSLKSLRNEFHLPGGRDDMLLDKVVAGLRFVKSIRPGDSIPREILDGTASWAVEDRHYDIAKGRLTLQISTWLSGEEQVISDQDSLLQLADDPAIKEKVNNAFADIAVKLGLQREQRQEVVDRIETVVRELAYIEALRERFVVIRRVRQKVTDFSKVYRRDRTFGEEIQRIQNLIMRPMGEVNDLLDQVDAQCGEFISLLRNLTSQIAFIRKCRDELHAQMMLWDDVILTWQNVTVERTTDNEIKLRELYRFLARNYNIAKAWQLTS